MISFQTTYHLVFIDDLIGRSAFVFFIQHYNEQFGSSSSLWLINFLLSIHWIQVLFCHYNLNKIVQGQLSDDYCIYCLEVLPWWIAYCFSYLTVAIHIHMSLVNHFKELSWLANKNNFLSRKRKFADKKVYVRL